MVEKHQLTLTAVCAHANLLDPTAPDTYGTAQIIKAVRLARDLGVKQVVTTEGDPKTAFGKNLTYEERIFTIVEKLHWPVQSKPQPSVCSNGSHEHLPRLLASVE